MTDSERKAERTPLRPHARSLKYDPILGNMEANVSGVAQMPTTVYLSSKDG